VARSSRAVGEPSRTASACSRSRPTFSMRRLNSDTFFAPLRSTQTDGVRAGPSNYQRLASSRPFSGADDDIRTGDPHPSSSKLGYSSVDPGRNLNGRCIWNRSGKDHKVDLPVVVNSDNPHNGLRHFVVSHEHRTRPTRPGSRASDNVDQPRPSSSMAFRSAIRSELL
jgi:hypothetical protein